MRITRFFLLLIILLSFKLSAKEIKFAETSTHFEIIDKSFSEFTIINYLSHVNTILVNKDDKSFVKLLVKGYGDNAEFGNAELPVLEELMLIPFGASVSIDVIKSEQKIISLNDYDIDNLILPNQPSISKSEDPLKVPFYFNNDYYALDSFHDSKIVNTEMLGVMRGQQLARLSVSPFQYNLQEFYEKPLYHTFQSSDQT